MLRVLKKVFKMHLSLKLLIVLVGTMLFGHMVPGSAKSLFYALSLSLKEILLFVLPFIIFSCLFACMLAQKGRAVGFMITLFCIVCASNLLTTFMSYGISFWGLSGIKVLEAHWVTIPLEPLWELHLKPLIANEYALLSGLVLGTIFSIKPSPRAHLTVDKLNMIVTFFLERLFLPVLPLFAFGFVLKMQHEGILQQIIHTYLPILVLIVVVNIFYQTLLYGILARFKPSLWLAYIKNVLPSGIMAFTTMSSMATLPVTLKSAEKNTQDLEISRAVVPASVNVHLIGDGFAIPMMAIAILLTFGYAFPSLSHYGIFALYFIVAKFAVAGVPGGSIFVMVPVLEKYLGFSDEMSALITALYILFDPIVTAFNVLGNGALVILMAKVFKKKQSASKFMANAPQSYPSIS